MDSSRKHFRRRRPEDSDGSRCSSPSSRRSNSGDRSRKRSRDEVVGRSSKHRCPSKSPTRKKHHRPKEDSPRTGKKESHRQRNYRRKSRSKSPKGDRQPVRNRSRSKERHSKRRDRSRSGERSKPSLNRNRERGRDRGTFKSNDRPKFHEKEPQADSRDDRSQDRSWTEKIRFDRNKSGTGAECTEERPQTKAIDQPLNKSPPAIKVQPPPPMASSSSSTPSAIALATAAAASLELPSYYNPAAINVTKYTNQIQKRKLLWANKNTQQNADKWQQQAQFSKDDDGKVASKFMRLMGIKKGTDSEDAASSSGTTSGGGGGDEEHSGRKSNEIAKKQSEMLNKMEQQYEVARQATHTMRGMGLGFSRQY